MSFYDDIKKIDEILENPNKPILDLSERAEAIAVQFCNIGLPDIPHIPGKCPVANLIESELKAVFEEGIESIPVEMQHQLDQWNEERMGFEAKLKAVIEAECAPYIKHWLPKVQNEAYNDAYEKAAQVAADAASRIRSIAASEDPNYIDAEDREAIATAEALAEAIRALKTRTDDPILPQEWDK